MLRRRPAASSTAQTLLPGRGERQRHGGSGSFQVGLPRTILPSAERGCDSIICGNLGTPSVGAGNVITLATTAIPRETRLLRTVGPGLRSMQPPPSLPVRQNNDANRFIVNVIQQQHRDTGNGI